MWNSNVFQTVNNLFKGNGFYGYDVEVDSNAYFFNYNRSAYNFGGAVVAGATMTLTDNTIIGNSYGIDVVHSGKIGSQTGSVEFEQVVKNNEVGLFSRNGGICNFNACQGWTYTGNRLDHVASGLALNVSTNINSIAGAIGPGQAHLYLDKSTNRVGGSAADCALVLQMYGGTEIEVSILVIDGACP